jgi:uncharacterized protein (DUF1501 family)
MAQFRKTDCEGFYRRDFLKIGAAGVFGLSLADLLRLQAQTGSQTNRTAEGVIMIWLAGGPATIDMWDLRPNAPENIRGPFNQISTSAPGIQICEHLPQMAQVMNKCTIVRSLAHAIPSHGLATVHMTTGNRPTPALQYPSFGALTNRLLPHAPNVPPYVSFGALRGGQIGDAGYLGSAFNAFVVNPPGNNGSVNVQGITLPTGFTLQQLENRNQLLNAFDNTFQQLDTASDMLSGMDAYHQQAMAILSSNATRDAFNINLETQATQQRYGNTSFGRAVLTARRLIEAGVRFVTVVTGGWDTHGQNHTRLRQNLLPPIDQSVSALIDDLHNRGKLGSTMVYVAGEFNRTPRINNNAGRDHWARSMSVVLAGGGIKRGYVHGSTDTQGMAPALDPCTPDDIAATMFQCMGIDPQHELMTPTGRPIQLFREGRVIDRILD